ncbi:glycosyltransferase [Ralstonia pickettii]|uniref:glycosyltransferase family 2 protein n=1 Tax=Ralstonia pickettii TaxID=329 RepID=UPI000CD53E19|nr:glycosyltransferase [Ralstonia pickettii]
MARRRQWGTERDPAPLSAVHGRPSAAKLALGRLAIQLTIVIWAIYVLSVVVNQFFTDGFGNGWRVVEALSYVVVVTALTFSALMYLIQRQGAFNRFVEHVRVTRAELDRHFFHHDRPLTVLIPSYAEEPDVIRKTIWSAALQEYPSQRIVLLIDDSPNPTKPDVLARLTETRGIPEEIMERLRVPRERFGEALLTLEHELLVAGDERELPEGAIERLAIEYGFGAAWLRDQAAQEHRDDHVDAFYIDEILLGLAGDLEATELNLRAALAGGEEIPLARLMQLHRRLAWIFTVEIGAFERKRYANLSAEANKAMNLNSYIGLIGGRYLEVESDEGLLLMPAPAGAANAVSIPYCDFVLTLDADSLLLREYCLRLVYFLEQPGNERVAVTQTPYSSFRGAPTRIERLAGATTDLQHILHQGMTAHNATFWVGANAVIRMDALDDIMQIDVENGFEVRRYVQDRTVIEDTESSVDLGEHGWSLVNYPERLSYSATPPDWGSLIVQRRRWANGGLLIMPKLWRTAKERRKAGDPMKAMELAIRVNYMASIAWASFGLVFLLAYPYDNRLVSPLVMAGALRARNLLVGGVLLRALARRHRSPTVTVVAAVLGLVGPQRGVLPRRVLEVAHLRARVTLRPVGTRGDPTTARPER